MMSSSRILLGLWLLTLAPSTRAQDMDETAHAWNGGSTIPPHRITLRDTDGAPIVLSATNAEPFSPRTTCGCCHEYEQIRHGLHFNYMDPLAPSGRAQQPWIFTDERTGTQLPLSYRGSGRTWDPAQAGLTPWEFTREFARHFPGGGAGEATGSLQSSQDWVASGPLEINCLLCHGGSPFIDHREWVRQIARGNFRWAATAASGIGEVSSAPTTTQAVEDPDRNNPDRVAVPSIRYNPALFNRRDRVIVEIAAKPKDVRCLFCHARAEAGQPKRDADLDVHSQKGVECVTCHRNGLDHQMVRGYEMESGWHDDPLRKASSCEGCHLGAEKPENVLALGGRLGAPVPQHKGLPPVHFEKLSCTACHSGPWPAGRLPTVAGPWPAGRLATVRKTRTNALGSRFEVSWDAAQPYVVEGVFMKAADGKIAPHRVLWPSFWAKLENGQTKPMKPEDVIKAAGNILGVSAPIANAQVENAQKHRPSAGDLPASAGAEVAATPFSMTEKQVMAILKALTASAGDPAARVAYIGSGKMFTLNAAGELAAADHPAAQPCAWPIAHKVRPAAQALGARACEECHAFDSPFFFAAVSAIGPLKTSRGAVEPMHAFEFQDGRFQRIFGLTFVLRPYFKAVGLAVATLIALILLIYRLPSLSRIIRSLSARK